MHQYQVVITKLTGGSRDDEDALTDLLNERERTGWRLHSSVTLEPTKLLLVFARHT